MNRTALWIEDMHCANCLAKVEGALQTLTGVRGVQINPVRKQVHVTHDDSVTCGSLVASIEGVGLHPQIAAVRDVAQTDPAAASLLKRFGVAGLCLMQIMMLQFGLYVAPDMAAETARLLTLSALLFCLPVVCYAALPFFHRGLLLPWHRGGVAALNAINMDTPIALAIALAFTASLYNTLTGSGEIYYDSVAMFTFLMLGTRVADQRLRQHLVREASLLSTLPRETTRIDGSGQRHKVALQALQAGDRVWIAAGEMLPADGVVDGSGALVDAALLNGESAPSWHAEGARVFAGSTNFGSGFCLVVDAPPQLSRLAALDRIASDAAARKLQSLRLVDTVARVFVPSILLIAAATYTFWWWQGSERALQALLAVLIVSCPCALSLAVPAAVNAGLGRLRRSGLLVRNAAALETAWSTSDVYFDKTGTLTEPTARLVDVEPMADLERAACLELAAALQVHTNHPLARAFHGYVKATASDVIVHPGQGVSGRVAGCDVRVGSPEFCAVAPHEQRADRVYLAVEGRAVARFVVAHQLRADARDTVARLQELGLTAHILTGDGSADGPAVARELGVDCISGMSPEDKQSVLAQRRGVFIGDGVNDLAALASAGASVATMETVDLVKAKADVLLTTSTLRPIAALFTVSRRVRRVMRQNLCWALAYNLVAIPVAAAGLASPWFAALGMSVSSLLVLGNALRVLRPVAGE